MPTLHGHLEDDGRTLVVIRTVPLPIEQTWAWVTEPERTAQWYGPWSGEGRVGGTITVTMASEEGSPGMPMRIEACAAPTTLALTSLGPAPFDWPLELHLSPDHDGGGTDVALRHLRLPADIPVRDIGPGWEYYLDGLVAAVEGRERASFEQLMADLGEQYAAL